jgi:hypothetical protein
VWSERERERVFEVFFFVVGFTHIERGHVLFAF